MSAAAVGKKKSAATVVDARPYARRPSPKLNTREARSHGDNQVGDGVRYSLRE
jgi:hypothetical protein